MQKRTPKEEFMASKMRKMNEEGGRPRAQKIAIMLSEAKKRGYKV